MLLSRTRVAGGVGILRLLLLPSAPSAPAPAAAPVTYSKDVAPLLNEHCVSCHAPGEIGPMSLTTHEAACLPRDRSIRW